MTPRTLNSALHNGYKIKNILYRSDKKCRVEVNPQFPSKTKKAQIFFWLDREYLKRAYPKTFDSFIGN
jgi:hypothetical protein